MYHKKQIDVVIPAYNVSKQILKVVLKLPDFVDNIIIVDDCCPENSSKFVKDIKKVHIIHHKKNLGVGGAMISGYGKAIELNTDIVVKVDGDGQMNTKFMEQLINPIVKGNADYTKGNRFNNFTALKSMPKIRLLGNSFLSFFIKAASGYWNIIDPTNGYTAIDRTILSSLELKNISKRYFFESDMLINLNIKNAVVMDINIPAKYANEKSSLSIFKTLFDFPPKIIKGLIKRIFFKYFLYDFNMFSIYLLLGLPMLLFGIFFGIHRWIYSIEKELTNSAGTIMLVVLPIILGIQFLLQSISIDIGNPNTQKK